MKISFLYSFFIVIFGQNILAQNIYTYAGNGTFGYGGDGGLAISAQLADPVGIVFDSSGNLYFSESANHIVRKVNSAGIISTICGTGSAGTTGDGGLATSAKLNQPSGISFDGVGNLYIADQGNHRIRKINTSGIISTIAGMSLGFAGDGGLASSALFSNPSSVAIDGSGNIYIADQGNHRIRMINTSGIINTVAGTTGGFSGDGGQATIAQLYYPSDIKLDMSGNLYISDNMNYRIRKVNSSGVINTIVGTGAQGNSGDGGSALSALIGGADYFLIDAFSNMYLSDSYYDVIRKVNSSGIISSITASGTGFSGDGGLASFAKVSAPECLALDASGNLYFSDMLNNRIRIICMNNCPMGINENEISISLKLYPNPSSSIINITSEQNQFQNSEIEISNYLCQTVLSLPYSNTIDVSKLAQGIYTLKIIIKENQSYYSKFVKE